MHGSPSKCRILSVAFSLLPTRVKAIACCAAIDTDITPKSRAVSQSARTVQGRVTGQARDEVTTEERSVACST